MREQSVFTKIVNGEIPSHKIYEDERTLAFLDVFPTVEGHTLVIPKNQVEFLWDLDDEDYAAVRDTAKKVAKRLQEVLGTKYIGEKVIGTDVPHAHIHLVPFDDPATYQKAHADNTEPDHEKLAALAKRLAF